MASGGSGISFLCKRHNDKYVTFCKKHDRVCCKKCVKEEHTTCIELAVIDDIVKNVKKSNVLSETEIKLNEMTANIKKIIDNRKENVKDLQKQRHYIETKINQTRKRINEHLDMIQMDLVSDLFICEEKESKQISTLIASFEKTNEEITDQQGTLEQIKRKANNIEIFLAIKQIETCLTAKEKIIQEIVKDDKVEYKSLQYNLDERLHRFEEYIQQFGNVKIETRHTPLFIHKKKQREAQIMLWPLHQNSIDNIRLTKQRVINIESKDITGGLLHPYGKVVVACDSEKRVLAYSTSGIKEFEVRLPNSRSFDMTLISDDTLAMLAVSGGASRCINIVNILTHKVIDTIKVNDYVFGVTFSNGEVFYCAYDKGIKALNLTDRTTRIIVNIRFSSFAYITSYRDKLIFTNRETNTVTCCSMDGIVHWKFKDEGILKDPRGISTDVSGNVFVVSPTLKNLVIISPDGKQCREILHHEPELSNPWSVSYDKNKNEILVGNNNGCAVVYSVNTRDT